MPVPVGFGVGDFVAVFGLVSKVSGALRESGGASSDYQSLVHDLNNLKCVLRRYIFSNFE
jgi:hypothetical protein